jgi:hypothetical protein
MTGSVINSDMATVDLWAPSRRMRAAAVAERERVEAELARLGERLDSLAEEIEAIHSTRAALEDELLLLQRLSRDDSDGPTAPATDGRRLRVVSSSPERDNAAGTEVLRGAEIRETAVRTLASATGADQGVHYRTWFELVRQAGYIPAGKDPLASFLTQIARSPVVQRSTAPGVYSLDRDMPGRERTKLKKLHGELEALAELAPSQDLDLITELRNRRARITAEIALSERRLTEAERSLGTRNG